MLQFLYLRYRESERWIKGETVIQSLGISKDSFSGDLQSLEDLGYIEVMKVTGEVSRCRITSKGRLYIDGTQEPPFPPQNQIIRILFLASNPKGTAELNLTREVKSIDEELQKARERDIFDLEQRHAVSLSELQELILRFEPKLLHFSGHGNEKGVLVFENEEGETEVAPSRALTNLFKIVNSDRKKVQCVVLNACYSERQAGAISKYVPCVIGMSNVVSDKAAIMFAASFYRALGYGQSVKNAFELGCNDIALNNIPKEATPKLKCAPGVDPTGLRFTKYRSE